MSADRPRATKHSRPASRALPTPTTRFGRLLRDRRLDLHMSQEEVGQVVGVGAQTVRKWEKGEKKPQPRFLDALVDFVGYPDRAHLTRDLDAIAGDRPPAPVIPLQGRDSGSSSSPTVTPGVASVEVIAATSAAARRSGALEEAAVSIIRARGGALTERELAIVDRLLTRADEL